MVLTMGPIYVSRRTLAFSVYKKCIFVLTPEAPMPWKARATINQIIDYMTHDIRFSTQPQYLPLACATPQRNDPRANVEMLKMMMFLRPKISDNFTNTGSTEIVGM